MKNLYIYFIRSGGGCFKNVVSVSLFIISGCQFLYGQNNVVTEHQVKAVFLYNFTQFIAWPPASFKSPDEPFIIGIIGNDPFGSFLDETVAEEKIGTHPIGVQRYNDPKNIGHCHILYINSNDKESIKTILSAVSEKSILTIGDHPDFCQWGGIVRFFTDQNKIRLQINVEQSRAVGLNISSKLLSVAKTD